MVTTIGGVCQVAKLAREEADVRLVRDARGAVAPEQAAADLPLEPAETEGTEESQEYGIRVNWQTEGERLEAAEFMLATRMQEDARRRVAAAALHVRQHGAEDLAAAVHHRPEDEPVSGAEDAGDGVG